MTKIPFIKEAIKSLFKSPVTDKYPHTKPEVPEGYRGKIKFNADLCVGCGMCIRVCSAESITKSVKSLADSQEITLRFDLGSCTFCKMCADFCGKKAIEFTPEYSLISVSGDKSNLIVEGSFIKKLPPKPATKTVAPAANASKTEGSSPAAESKIVNIEK
jgi:formate hydrogenlyase subunit 6/NADH:ubiquinone oxidoreductase subunit I